MPNVSSYNVTNTLRAGCEYERRNAETLWSFLKPNSSSQNVIFIAGRQTDDPSDGSLLTRIFSTRGVVSNMLPILKN